MCWPSREQASELDARPKPAQAELDPQSLPRPQDSAEGARRAFQRGR